MIEERAETVEFAPLKRAVAAMSENYREGGGTASSRLAPLERTAAYLVSRMPATYAAAHMVLSELRGLAVASVLDIGAGAGAASLAAREFFPEAAITMIERDAALADAARLWLPGAKYVSDDVTHVSAFPPHDLVIAAYSLGELSAPVTRKLWQAARVAMVAIEPGTPRGFTLIRKIRSELLDMGAWMAAPCPAGSPCPVVDPDWCHFAARVERSSMHRRLKDAGLGYEDEKFSYVAVVRDRVELPTARITGRPRHQPGLIALPTCTPEGLRIQTVSKRDRERFRAARKAAWGEPFNPVSLNPGIS